MEFLKKNQFKMAAIAVSLLVVCIVAIFVIPKFKKEETETTYHTINFTGVEGNDIYDQIVLPGGRLNEPQEPIKEGYIFLGWYVGSSEFDFEDAIYKDLTIEAKWEKDGVEEEIEEEKPEEEEKEETDENKKPTTNNNNKPSNNNNNNKPTTPSKVNVTSVTLNKTNATLEIGQSVTLTATVNPNNATNKTVSWKSSNTSVATVNNGVVTAVGAGSTTITASADGKTVTCTITVNKKVEITYSVEWQRIESSSIGEYYLYIVGSDGKKVSGKVNVVYTNGKTKEHDVTTGGVKLVKSVVSSASVISTN